MATPQNADQARLPGAKPGVSFRAEAVEHHRRRGRQTTLPQLLGPRALALLWLVPLTLALATVGLLFAPLPAYVSGLVVVLPPSGSGAPAVEGIAALIILPPEASSSLRSGQLVALHGGRAPEPGEHRPEGRIVSIAPGVLDAAAIEQQFRLPEGAMAAITRPCLVAVTAFPPSRSGEHAWGPAGAPLSPDRVHAADVLVGQTRVGALLPVLRRFFPANEPRSAGPC
jgi:hypothetical protein